MSSNNTLVTERSPQSSSVLKLVEDGESTMNWKILLFHRKGIFDVLTGSDCPYISSHRPFWLHTSKFFEHWQYKIWAKISLKAWTMTCAARSFHVFLMVPKSGVLMYKQILSTHVCLKPWPILASRASEVKMVMTTKSEPKSHSLKEWKHETCATSPFHVFLTDPKSGVLNC